MNKKLRSKLISLIASFVVFVVACVILLSESFAWFSQNKTVSAIGMSVKVSEPDKVMIDSTLTAVRHSLTGEVVTDTYTVDDLGNIYLINRSTVYPEGSDEEDTSITYAASDKMPFVISEILPGEYIDITVGYYLADSLDGRGYTISLGNITSGAFEVDDKVHYASGAFKYKNVSLVNKADSALEDYSDETLTWFTTYDYENGEDETDDILMVSKTWDSDDEMAYYTFRIQEDFSQYYNLIGKSTVAYGNLLSKKGFYIGSIKFEVADEE